jgi:hypothetical protein
MTDWFKIKSWHIVVAGTIDKKDKQTYKTACGKEVEGPTIATAGGVPGGEKSCESCYRNTRKAAV